MKIVTKYDTGKSVMMKGTVWNICIISGGGGILGGVLGTSTRYVIRI